MASASTSISQHIDDILECPVCCENFTDPRSLPCIHTYCLKCIKGFCSTTKPGGKVACPLCRKTFVVPEEGLNALPKNFFIEKMLQAKHMAAEENQEQVCDVCESDEIDKGRKIRAEMFCADCMERLCGDCARVHSKSKATRSHKQIAVEEIAQGKLDEVFSNSSPSYCEKHRDQVLNIYCNNCNTAACVVCYIASHKEHQCSDINEIVAQFRKRMSEDSDELVNGLDKVRVMLSSVETQGNELTQQVKEAEVQIKLEAQKLRKLVDDHEKTLLRELEVKCQMTVKKLTNLSHDLTQQIAFMSSLKKYTDQLLERGTGCDIAREGSSLHGRTKELVNLEDLEECRSDMHTISVNFEPVHLPEDEKSNFVGAVNITTEPQGNFSAINVQF